MPEGSRFLGWGSGGLRTPKVTKIKVFPGRESDLPGLEYQKDAFKSFATLGLQRSSLQKGKTAVYTNSGTAGSYTDTSSAATCRTATVGFSYAAEDSMNITGTAGISSAGGGIKGSSVSLSASLEF